ncbi:hypothetical protein PR048_032474 [Dryococelus australis]|uniref:FLYWCH-type domain-containing protein n=1 Tax=Dryococelus australis TaxID=614101 RepID=A0ABQ9G2B7_9NEOP|nr:hypothetical protein PR048_032474 [Dryococelus australis]
MTDHSAGELELVRSKRCMPQLVYRNCFYNKEATCDNRTVWTCVDVRKMRCRARVHTFGHKMVVHCLTHTHAPHLNLIQKKRLHDHLLQRLNIHPS